MDDDFTLSVCLLILSLLSLANGFYFQKINQNVRFIKFLHAPLMYITNNLISDSETLWRFYSGSLF